MPRKVAFLLAVGFLFAGAAGAETVVGVGEQHAGKTVRLHPGDYLSVSLGANATTGYSWKLKSVDRAVLRPDSTGYIASQHAPGIVGSGGIAVLTFKALAKGRTVLKLAYVGPGTNAPTGRTFSLTVVVS